MNNPIAARIKALREALERNQQAQRSRIITENCEDILDHLAKPCQDLQRASITQQVLQGASVQWGRLARPSVATRGSAQKAQVALASFRKVWAQEQDEARNNRSLEAAHRTTVALAGTRLDELRAAWGQVLGEIRDGFQVDPQVLGTAKTIPGNERACAEFESLRIRFDREAEDLPEEPKTLTILTNLGKDLGACRERIHFDLPKSVKAFFKALELQPNGVPLGQIKRDVLDWLEANGLANNFRVRRG